MGSPKGASGSTTSTSNSAPWAAQQPYLTDVFQHAQDLYKTGGPQYFPDQTFAPENAMQSDALGGVGRLAGTDALATTAPNMANNILSGNYLGANPAYNELNYVGGQANILGNVAMQNPALGTFGSLAGPNSAIDSELSRYTSGANLAAGNPNTSALTQNIMSSVVPSIQSQFISGGGLSSPEAAYATASGATSALAPTLANMYQQEEQNTLNAIQQQANTKLGAAQGLSNTFAGGVGAAEGALGIGNNAASGLSNAYSGGMNNILQALGLAPGAQSMYYTPEQNLFAAGGAQQQLDQLPINSAVQRWNYGQTLPWNNLNQYIGQVTGNYGGTTSLTQPYFSNSGQNALGGAASGAMLAGSLLPGVTGASGAGAGLGALLGLFSDERVKADIKHVGKLDNGLKVYSYRYIDDPENLRRIGLIAQEVEGVHPEAVGIEPNTGLKVVDYSKAIA
jgi:hypothetical protein